ncbi:chromosome segregation protein SMC [Thalassotalea hakodatensis]|uniref:chromosome segregation protein SMC n=1 Tax=Thalassotalea hakodatensis TaxID=3030492 RepID=UPI0025733FC8|nr:chromosome segregation protein SMC [Thalassotalea hakodatensis]
MRLKYIKLAGFKSFVDPTKVPFEQQMTAIVGPNGCGKSNIIDAVRWVLGESSAKHLRGDAMTDVIFNGAASRKPIGQASVELMFDNMADRFQGSMADRNQVSIRRVVNRDSQNTYYLNGAKCRRKDITDIFLGTGLGPRSYAIIEQGTISRLIESKPQELRVFIEEAAGISKYKERRRETENRIRHTRENLDRLTDIRLELTQQIEKLHIQAEGAKRFKTLKAEERQLKAELAVLRWQSFEHRSKLKQQEIQKVNDRIAELKQTQQADALLLTNAKQQIQTANSQIQHCQQDKIVLTNDIARAEQQITHEKAQQKQRRENVDVLKAQMEKAQKMLLHEQQYYAETQQKFEKYTKHINSIEAQIVGCEQQHHDKTTQLQQYQLELQQRNLAYRDSVQVKNHFEKQQSVFVSELEQQQRQLNKVNEQHETLALEKSALMKESLFDEQQIRQVITEKEQQLRELNADLKATLLTQQQHAETISKLRGDCRSQQQRVDEITKKLSQQENWQQAQLSTFSPLLKSEMCRVQDLLQVKPGWELAVEMVLEQMLQAHVFDLPWHEAEMEKLNTLDACFLYLSSEDNQVEEISTHQIQATLASKVSSEVLPRSLFYNVLIATDETACFAKREKLKQQQSVICPQGVWLGNSFIRKGQLTRSDNVLLLTNEKQQLEQSYQQSIQQLKDSETLLQGIYAQIDNVEKTQEEVSKQLISHQQQLLEATQFNATWQQKYKHIEKQQAHIQREQQSLTQTINKQKVDLITWEKEQHVDYNVANDELVASMALLEKKIEQHNAALSDINQQHQSLKENFHQQQILLERSKHESQLAQQNISRYQTTIDNASAQQKAMNNDESLPEEKLSELNEKLQQWLASSSALDNEIEQQHKVIATQQVIFQQMEQNASKTVEQIEQHKHALSQLQLSAESFSIKAENALEQLDEIGKNATDIAQSLSDSANESLWQAKLIKVQNDIQRLGAINLAAIDEYESQLTRKNYLDQQDQDLNQAISTLESAIEKIDKESRLKFKTTFDKVNHDLQTLFPKVFGGGDAYLALTGDDLLETGVTIMARPPGKKNSTIHLLSGGEKALTALSLVFAIFRLNPAPFCMLDEVDAPLDDANVERFCNLVREMSNSVQFIYISHNKIAMEMASHLTGVTMFEPGVSRMVSVDVEEAIAMAEVS